jgi:hypothetical protein
LRKLERLRRIMHDLDVFGGEIVAIREKSWPHAAPAIGAVMAMTETVRAASTDA